jgi:hypothetical protein
MCLQIGVHIHLTHSTLTKQVIFMPYYVIVNNASYIIECQEADRRDDPWVKVNGANDRQMFPNTGVLVIAKGYDLCGSLMENVVESAVKRNLLAV